MSSSYQTQTSVSRQTRTETGPDGKRRTIITETTVGSDGSKTTVTKETTGGASGDDLNANFKGIKLKDEDESRSKSFFRKFSPTSSSSEKKAPKPQSMKDFADEMVKMHNKMRHKHGKVGDLKHSRDLDVLAQRWADHLAKTNLLKHSNDTYKGEELGENVASKWETGGADYTGKELMDQWSEEEKKYDYNNYKQGTGHFTQMVWKGSKEIGIGKAHAPDGRVYVVCNYHPGGNVIGKFQENVFPPK